MTPFRRDGALDESTLRRLVRRQIDEGVHFLVPCGTTGESPTLSRDEHLRVVELTVSEAQGQVPVVAGCGGYNTAEVIALGLDLAKLGVDGLLSVTPYYNKPTQEGLFQHYRAIAEAVRLPIIVYNVPGRTGVNVEPSTLKRLADLEHIVAVKEASGNVAQVASICAQVPPQFAVLSGDDSLGLPTIALGGRGLISVASNQIPRQMSTLIALANAGKFTEARQIQHRYQPLLDVNFIESNPGPVKASMAAMGLLERVWRLPLVAPSKAAVERIEAAMNAVDLPVRERTLAD